MTGDSSVERRRHGVDGSPIGPDYLHAMPEPTVIRPNRILQVLWLLLWVGVMALMVAAGKDANTKIVGVLLFVPSIVGALLSFGDYVELGEQQSLKARTVHLFVWPRTFEMRPMRDGVRILNVLPFGVKTIYVGSHRLSIWMYGTGQKTILRHAQGKDQAPPSQRAATSRGTIAASGTDAEPDQVASPDRPGRPESTGRSHRRPGG